MLVMLPTVWPRLSSDCIFFLSSSVLFSSSSSFISAHHPLTNLGGGSGCRRCISSHWFYQEEFSHQINAHTRIIIPERRWRPFRRVHRHCNHDSTRSCGHVCICPLSLTPHQWRTQDFFSRGGGGIMIDATPGLKKLMSMGGGGGDSDTFFWPQIFAVNFSDTEYCTSPTSLTSNNKKKKISDPKGGRTCLLPTAKGFEIVHC